MRTDLETLAELKEIDAVCLRFEDAWRAGSAPRLESFLGTGSSELLGELLPLEWSYRVKAGEAVSEGEYARRFPGHAPAVTAAWQRWKGCGNAMDSTIGLSDESRPESSPWLPVVPGCEKVELIGRGGMGEVFRAYDTHLRRPVAVKRVRLERASPDHLRRFHTEAEVLARLGHPHIVTAHAFHDDGGNPLLVMEYVAGGSLSGRLGDGPLPPAVAARLVAVLAWAVEAAHRSGVVHRDLKPDNVLMAEPVAGSPDNVLGGFPKITDFGLAALVETSSGATLDGEIFGTPHYMAPEQAAGKTRSIGKPCDVWALGVILYRCLTGLVPFRGDSVLETLDRVRAMRFCPPREVDPSIPAALEAVCLGCLREDPAGRPTAKELAERLEPHLGGSLPPTVVHPPPPRRRSRLIGAAAVLAAGALVVTLGLALRGKPPETATGPAAPLRVSFDVADFEFHAGADHANGTIGRKVFAARIDERVVVRAELSEPAYCFLIACNFDGKEQLLWPCDEATTTGAADKPPAKVSNILYPPPTVPTAAGRSEPRGLKLDDDREGGLQAFLVVASREPLPPYREWRSGRGASPWTKLPPGDGVWRSSGDTLDPVTPGDGAVRGSVVTLAGQPPLLELCRWAGGKDLVVNAIAFPVKREEK